MWIRSSFFDAGQVGVPHRAACGRLAGLLPPGPSLVKQQLEQLLREALRHLSMDDSAVAVDRTRDAQHGDFATNVALRLAKGAQRKPQELAQAIVAALPPNPFVSRAEVAGPGFINFFLTPQAYANEIGRIHELGERYGESTKGQGERVIVEFVSANPTGPLHVGHGRQAAYGATLANLLTAIGYSVYREYYINDAGRQMDILAVSTWLRYLERLDQTIAFPTNGYRGDYVGSIAEKLQAQSGTQFKQAAQQVAADLPADGPEGDKEKHIDALIARARELLGVAGFQRVLDFALAQMIADIRNDLQEFGVEFDRWYSEAALGESGAIERALERLSRQGRLFQQGGATWFRATEFGDEKDRVVVRENGQKTYFASDIAYHLEKRERGFARLVDVLGADHHGYIARVRAGLAAMGEPGDSLEVKLVQFVSLFRGGEKIPMGKREAQFVTLRQLRAEVGNDACRFFYLMRSHEQPLDFDLELAKSRTNENPVYYIQYAHARVASVMKQLEARGLTFDLARGLGALARLDGAHEQAVMSTLTRYCEAVELAALNRAPHALVYYLRELANTFHTYYNAEQFIVEDAQLRDARLALVLAAQQVIRNGLSLLGVSAPQSM
jgi:arginyl-tRNA synthetase